MDIVSSNGVDSIEGFFDINVVPGRCLIVGVVIVHLAPVQGILSLYHPVLFQVALIAYYDHREVLWVLHTPLFQKFLLPGSEFLEGLKIIFWGFLPLCL